MTSEEYIEDLKYDIFIHDSTESIYNLESENQMIKIGNGEIKEIFITKSNLELICTEVDPCVSDDTVRRNECQIKSVSDMESWY